jgi:hypothetical protein
MSTKHEQQRTPKHYAPSAAAAFNATPELRKAIAPPPNPGMLVLDKTAFDLGFRCVTASVAATDVRTVKEDKRVRG